MYRQSVNTKSYVSINAYFPTELYFHQLTFSYILSLETFPLSKAFTKKQNSVQREQKTAEGHEGTFSLQSQDPQIFH